MIPDILLATGRSGLISVELNSSLNCWMRETSAWDLPGHQKLVDLVEDAQQFDARFVVHKNSSARTKHYEAAYICGEKASKPIFIPYLPPCLISKAFQDFLRFQTEAHHTGDIPR